MKIASMLPTPRFGRCGRALAALLLACSAAAVAQAPATAPPVEEVWITGTQLLDVRSGRMLPEPTLLVRDGRIVEVGGAAPPAGARHIDLPGMTLLPGLIDMHVHLDVDPAYGGYTGLQFNDRFWSMLAVEHARRTLHAGFTTVRNVGSSDWNDVGLRQAVDAGHIEGPRVVSAAYSFGATGGHCDATYFPPSMEQRNPFNADSPDEARKRVRELRKHGAQVIKLCATGGVFSRNTEPGQQQMRLQEMQAAVDEASRWGLTVAAHAHGAAGIREAIEAGVTTIEHASLIDETGIALARKRGAALSMDIYNTDYTQAEGKRNGVLEDNLRKDREIGELQRQNFRRAHEAGVRMVFGTDAGVYPHGDNARQFAVMVRYGMTPLEAIQAATLHAAGALHRDDVGVLEPGRFADLVAVRGDPTKDIRLLEAIPVVVKGGRVVKGASAEATRNAATGAAAH